MFKNYQKNPMYQQKKFVGQVRDVVSRDDIASVIEPNKAKAIVLFGDSLEDLNSDVVFVYEEGCGTRPSDSSIRMGSLKAAIEAVGKQDVVVMTYKALAV